MDILQLRLRELREDKDLIQSEVAKKCKITQRKLSFIEQGKTEPNLQDIREFCKFYNVSADFLLGLPKNMPYPKR